MDFNVPIITFSALGPIYIPLSPRQVALTVRFNCPAPLSSRDIRFPFPYRNNCKQVADLYTATRQVGTLCWAFKFLSFQNVRWWCGSPHLHGFNVSIPTFKILGVRICTSHSCDYCLSTSLNTWVTSPFQCQVDLNHCPSLPLDIASTYFATPDFMY